jgi:hypothetical protein
MTATISTAIPDAGTDAFFESQVALLRAAGHWAECTSYNAIGNHHSAISVVPVAGMLPELAFHGQRSHVNVFRLEVRLYRGESVLMTVGNHVHRDEAPRAFVEPALYSLEVLKGWFADFVAHAKTHARG